MLELLNAVKEAINLKADTPGMLFQRDTPDVFAKGKDSQKAKDKAKKDRKVYKKHHENKNEAEDIFKPMPEEEVAAAQAAEEEKQRIALQGKVEKVKQLKLKRYMGKEDFTETGYRTFYGIIARDEEDAKEQIYEGYVDASDVENTDYQSGQASAELDGDKQEPITEQEYIDYARIWDGEGLDEVEEAKDIFAPMSRDEYPLRPTLEVIKDLIMDEEAGGDETFEDLLQEVASEIDPRSRDRLLVVLCGFKWDELQDRRKSLKGDKIWLNNFGQETQ